MNTSEKDLQLELLRKHVKELQEELDRITPKRNISSLTKNEPYCGIERDEKTGEFKFFKRKTIIWEQLRNATKELFILEAYNGYKMTTKPSRISQLSREQQEIAAKFLDDCIDLFNKYFVEINKTICVDGKMYEV